ncbi:putative palmitoyltransferase ZDHHC4-like protein, partial [Corchorus capsularis]
SNAKHLLLAGRNLQSKVNSEGCCALSGAGASRDYEGSGSHGNGVSDDKRILGTPTCKKQAAGIAKKLSSSILRIRRFRDYITPESDTPPICGTSASLQSSECRNLYWAVHRFLISLFYLA